MEYIKLNIDLSFNQLLEVVKQLSAKERMELNDVLWNEETEIPVEHQKIVLDRIAKANLNPERLLDWDEVSKKI